MEASGGALRYPVIFRERDGRACAGALTIESDAVLLDGGAGEAACQLRVPFVELSAVHVARSPSERLSGRPVLVLERGTAPPLHIAPLGAGLLAEMADLVSRLTIESQAVERAAIRVPLRAHSAARVRVLVDRGPPFDPAALDLDHHAVFLGRNDVTFLFVGRDARAAVERAMRSPTVWRAGLAWRDCISGPPQLTDATEFSEADAELLYSWTARR